MRRVVTGAEFASIENWRWGWNVAGEYSYRDFRSLAGVPAQADEFFVDSSGMDLRASVHRSLIQFPERRFSLDGSATGEAGRFFTNPLGKYGRMQGSLDANWFPRAQGDDYQTSTMLRAGKTFGQVPFDDLWMLGFDRDNDLWMRGHNGLMDGKKGNAPLGRNYVLSNSDVEKVVFHDAFVQVQVGPFLDTGNIYDPSQYFRFAEMADGYRAAGEGEAAGEFFVCAGVRQGFAVWREYVLLDGVALENPHSYWNADFVLSHPSCARMGHP